MPRLTSFVLIVLLAVPMFRDCCLRVTASSECHRTAQIDDPACAANQQAVVQAKRDGSAESAFAEAVALIRTCITVPEPRSRFAGGLPSTYSHAIDICLRTGALLI